MACLSGGPGMRLGETNLKMENHTHNNLGIWRKASSSSSSSSLSVSGGKRRRMKVAAMAVQHQQGQQQGGTGGGGGGGKLFYKGTQMREKQLTEMIEEKVKEATEVCEGDPVTDECKVAWDQVEEVSQAKADLRLKLDKNKDPLESFCQDNPETDECRIYDD